MSFSLIFTKNITSYRHRRGHQLTTIFSFITCHLIYFMEYLESCLPTSQVSLKSMHLQKVVLLEFCIQHQNHIKVHVFCCVSSLEPNTNELKQSLWLYQFLTWRPRVLHKSILTRWWTLIIGAIIDYIYSNGKRTMPSHGIEI